MHAGRQVVVDQHVAGRRDPQADDVVDEEAMPGRAVDAGEAEGKDEGAEDEVHHRPHEGADEVPEGDRSEEHTSELQSLMRISYAVFCLKKKTSRNTPTHPSHHTTAHTNTPSTTTNRTQPTTDTTQY